MYRRSQTARRTFFTAEECSFEGEQGQPRWAPIAFSYSPGVWLSDPNWSAYHKHIGKIGSGLLKLSTNSDQWPILIGGYLVTLARINAFGVVRVGVLLKNLDLAQGPDYVRRQAQARQKLECALDRLAAPEIEVIASWRFAKTPEALEPDPDMDDPDSLTDYGKADVYPAGDWRS